MGKDKVKPPAAPAAPAPAPLAPGTRPPKGHKQRGAGTVITAKPAVVTGDGIVLKAHERLPFQLVQEYCQREKRPNAKYYPNPPGRKFKVVLPDGKNEKNDMVFATTQSFESDSVAKDFAALLALFHLQRNFPLERRLPEPYATSWLTMIAAEKELNRSDAKPGRGGAAGGATKAPAAAAIAPAVTSALPVMESNSKPPADTAAPAVYNKNKSTNVAPVLNRDTADWLCDNCGHQNFACLASGLPRLKCFRCQTPKSATCQLVGSSADTAPSSDNAKPVVAKPAIAAVNLLTGKNSTANFATKAEEERALQEKRAVQKRKQYYFDALRRANRPHIVHIPVSLRVKLEALLGMVSSGTNNASMSGDDIQLEDLLQTYQESGLFPPDLCNIPVAQQHLVLKRVSAHLIAQGFHTSHVANTLHEVLLQSADDLLDECLETLEGSGEAENSARVVALFEKSLSEACLKHLCMNLEETQLPDAYNPKFFEQNKKLSVLSGAAPPVPGPNAAVKSSSAGGKTSPVSESAQPIEQTELDLAIASNPVLLGLWNDLCTHNSCNTNTNTGSPSVSRVDCVKALLTAGALTTAGGASTVYDINRLYILSLLLLEHACSTAFDISVLPAALDSLRSALQPGSTAVHDFDVLTEEIESLEAIFESNITSRYVADSVLPYHDIRLAVSLEQLNVRTKFTLGKLNSLALKIVVPALCAYPAKPPLVYLYTDDASVSAGSSTVLAELQASLREKAVEFSGEMMIYQLYSYLQECIDQHSSAGVVTSSTAVGANSAVAKRLEVVGAYLSGNDALFQELLRSSSTATATQQSVPVAAGSASSKKTPAAYVDNTDSDTVTTQATYTTSSSRTTSNTASKGNKNRSVHSFWTTSTAAGRTNISTEKMMESRRKLPSFNMREEIINMVHGHRAIVVTGETGCGKTTQVPQFLYESNSTEKILICQPRRLAAVGVATRVAEEVGCAVGQEVKSCRINAIMMFPTPCNLLCFVLFRRWATW